MDRRQPQAASAGTLALAGFSVPRLGFGTLRLPPERAGAVRLLRRAYELGVRLVDTADVYGPETAEEAVADAFSPYPADLLVATKGGASPRQGPSWTADGSPAYLRRACEASLRRLRIDAISLYQLHVPDPNIPLEESVGGLADLQREGKIRHIGLSNVDVAQLEEARRISTLDSGASAARPNTRACPLVGRVTPSRTLTVVVLPAPFFPRSPQMEPAGTWRLKPRTASTPS